MASALAGPGEDEARTFLVYSIRLAGFVLILVAIIDKNRAHAAPGQAAVLTPPVTA
jgi:hypothetical protein